MGDRICIRITNGEEVSPTFYGHWCGVRGLKEMTEAVREPYSTMGNLMCNFIAKIMEGEPKKDSYELWNPNDGDHAADWDWWLWTYHCHLGTWTTTHPMYNDKVMTTDEVEALVRRIRPCLYRTCPCDNYGGDRCFAYFQDKLLKMKEIREREKKKNMERHRRAMEAADRGTCNCDTCRHLIKVDGEAACDRDREMTPEGWQAMECGACPLWDRDDRQDL